MKKLSIILTAILMAQLNMNAQSDEEEIDYMQLIWGMERKSIYAEFITAEGQVIKDFWRLYDEYEAKGKTLGKNRFKLLDEYTENYDSHTPEQLDKMMDQLLKQKADVDKLIKSYYKKIRKESGSKVAAQFLQMENYMLAAARCTIMETIPFIGELDEE